MSGVSGLNFTMSSDEVRLECQSCESVMLRLAGGDGVREEACPECRTLWRHHGTTMTGTAGDLNKCNTCHFGKAWLGDSYRCADCVAFSRYVPSAIGRTYVPAVVASDAAVDDAAVERDPTGKSASEPGAKLDAGKTRPSLILSDMPRALMAVAEVATFGARKYSAGGWQLVENGVERYTDAMDRHRLAEFIDGPTDPQSKLLHRAHLAWNALASLELCLREQEAGHAA